MQALKLHDELKADGLRRKTGKDEPSGNEEAIRGRLQEFVSSNDFASYACLVVPDGSVLAAAEGPDGTPAGIEALVASLNGLVQSYPRETLRRLILDDDLGTVVLARVGNGASVIVIARKGAPLGAVSMNVGRLAAGLE
jgi:predicted regulator of Ras-like GTPase activity (Roadblock/LC7/MglB family)